jgi:HSP20 family protein
MRLGLSVWEPYNGLNLFSESFHKLIEDTAKTLSRFEVEDRGTGGWAPRVDVCETNDSYIVSADLPGIKKEDIEINLKDNTLTVTGEKKYEAKSDKDNYVRVERKYGKFLRRVSLSENVDKGKIKATYKDGVLEIKIPKREEVATKPVKVEVN